MTETTHNVTDDSLVVRQITQYQFTWRAGDDNAPGTHVLQLVLDEGAFEEVLTVDPVDSLALQLKLASSASAFYDQRNRSIVTNVVPVGAGIVLAAS